MVCRGSGKLEEKMKNANAVDIEFNQSLLSSPLFSVTLNGLKKGKVKLCLLISLYGRFLLSITKIKAPIMIITIIIATTPNSTVPVDARPVTGGAVGDGDGDGGGA